MPEYIKVAMPTSKDTQSTDTFGKRFFFTKVNATTIVTHNSVVLHETSIKCTQDSLKCLLARMTPKATNAYGVSTKDPSKDWHLDEKVSKPNVAYLAQLGFPTTILGRFSLDAVGVNIDSTWGGNIMIISHDNAINVPVNGHVIPDSVAISVHVTIVKDTDTKRWQKRGYKPRLTQPPQTASKQLECKAAIFKQAQTKIAKLVALDFNTLDPVKDNLVLTQGIDPLGRFKSDTDKVSAAKVLYLKTSMP